VTGLDNMKHHVAAWRVNISIHSWNVTFGTHKDGATRLTYYV